MEETERSRPRVIPAGLRRCPTCGEYLGSDAISPSYRFDLLEIVSVTCVCDGIPCTRCGRPTHRPITNFFVEETGRIVHAPWFGQLIPSRRCRAKGGGGTSRGDRDLGGLGSFGSCGPMSAFALS